MVNLEHRLTVDDLIVTYIVEKTKQGYIPEVTEKEFMDFLQYFNSKKEVDDILFDYTKLINRFFERKSKRDWGDTPHIVLTAEGILKPNNKLSCYDESVINPYFMSIDEREEINNYITEYLKNFPKRSLDMSVINNMTITESCKLSSALVMEILWRSMIDKEIKYRKWPSQCKDIIKYLLEDDLATKIELKSIKKDLLIFYKDLAQKSSFLLGKDPNLEISSFTNSFLSYSNYQLIIGDQKDNLLESFCQTYGNGIKINYDSSSIKIQTLSNCITFSGEDEEYNRSEINFLTSKHAKRLVKAIEESK